MVRANYVTVELQRGRGGVQGPFFARPHPLPSQTVETLQTEVHHRAPIKSARPRRVPRITDHCIDVSSLVATGVISATRPQIALNGSKQAHQAQHMPGSRREGGVRGGYFRRTACQDHLRRRFLPNLRRRRHPQCQQRWMMPRSSTAPARSPRRTTRPETTHHQPSS